jgi:hypothetical protein
MILVQFHPQLILTASLIFILMFYLFGIPNVCFPVDFPARFMYYYLVFPMQTIYPGYYNLPNIDTIPVLGNMFKS